MNMVTAFIFAGGNNIFSPQTVLEKFNEKPLIVWNIEALEAVNKVDSVVIATNSHEIEQAINMQNYTKTKIYHLTQDDNILPDTAHCAALAYAKEALLKDNTGILIVQPTNVFATTCHFSEAIDLWAANQHAMIVSAVRTSKQSEPWVENQCFRLLSVETLQNNTAEWTKETGYYSMPAHTLLDITKEKNWLVAEELLRQSHKMANRSDKMAIKLFLCDVDGTLTDGGMYYDANGEVMKKFCVHDGMGLQLLQKTGIKVGIITSENTPIVASRAKKLGIDFLRQGKRDGGKLEAAKDICQEMGISLSQVAYIGDDINCQNLLEAAGMRGCPANAMPQIKQIPGILIMQTKGGEGCVREMINKYILRVCD